MTSQTTRSRWMAALTAATLFWTAGASPLAAARRADDIWAERRQALDRRGGLSALPAPILLERVTQALIEPAPRPEILPAEAGLPAWMAGWPLSAVHVDEIHAAGRPDVILIKDLHAQLEAQKNIAAFLTGLAWDGRRVLVGVEGASGTLDFRPFRAFGNARLTKELAAAYLSWDWIQAPEYAGLTGPESLRFTGVEDDVLYEGNIRAYVRADKARPAALAALKKLDDSLEAVKASALTAPQRRVDQAARLYRADRSDTGSFLQTLAAEAPAVFKASRFPQTALFLQARAMESSLDFNAAQGERELFLRRLTEALPPDALRSLTGEALRFRTGDRDAGAFHEKLLAVGRRAGIRTESFPALAAYVRYAVLADRIDRAGLLAEMESVEDAAWEALSPGPKQSELRLLSRDAALAEKLADQALNDEEWSRYAARRAGLSSLAARARAAGAGGAPSVDLSAFESFYRFARARNGSLTRRLLSARRSGDEAAVLVAGGFHAAGVVQELRKRGLSYVLLSPRIEKIDAGKNALAVFTRGPTPLDRLMMGERIFLANRVSMGLPAAPAAARARVMEWETVHAAVAAAEDPAHARQAVAAVDKTAAGSKAFPRAPLAIEGAPEVGAGRTTVEIRTEVNGRSIRQEVTLGEDARGDGPGRQALPPEGAKEPLIVTVGDASVPAKVRALPTGRDHAARWTRWILPAASAAIGISASFAAANPWTGVAAAFVFRLAITLNKLLNEAGHVTRGASLGYGGRAVNEANLRGNIPVGRLILTLIPVMPDLTVPFTTRIAGVSQTHDPLIRRGGFWVGTAVSIAGLILLALPASQGPPAGVIIWSAYAAGAIIALAGAWVTDMTEAAKNVFGQGVYACGDVFNMGHLRPGEKTAYPKRVQKVQGRMIAINQSRGGQSGGGSVLTSKKGHPLLKRTRRENSRRGDLAKDIVKDLTDAAGRTPPHDGVYSSEVHTRYATGSRTKKSEAHPHDWKEYKTDIGDREVFSILPPGVKDDTGSEEVTLRRVLLKPWSLFKGRNGKGASRLMRAVRPVQHHITHNGDNDVLTLNGVDVDLTYMGFVLERILDVPNRWDGDSPMIAGAMELFTTQGLWAESLRLAFQEAVAPPPDLSSLPKPPPLPENAEAARKMMEKWKRDVRKALVIPAPTQKTLEKWAQVARDAFMDVAERPDFLPEGAATLSDVSDEARRRLVNKIAGAFDGLVKEIPRDRAEAFAEAAVTAFLDNDLNTAARKFKRQSQGTYGLILKTSLEPNVVVALAKDQPLSLGFKETVLNGVGYHDVAVQSEAVTLKVLGEDDKTGAFDHRLDLDDDGGEIVRIDMTRGPGRPPLVTLYSVSEDRDYTAEQLAASGRLIPLKNNPLIEPLPETPEDLPNADQNDTPKVLRAVRDSMKDPKSLEDAAFLKDPKRFNRQTAEAFAGLFFSRERPRIYLIGIATDLDVVRQFMSNFRAMFPDDPDLLDRADIVAASSNEVLLEPWRFPVNKETMVLAASQSGSDFPTYNALRLLQRQMEAVGNDASFVLTGQLDSKMGQMAGQGYSLGSPFCRRIFTNMAGWRPSEATVVTDQASHLLLTELLLLLSRRALSLGRAPHGHALSQAEQDQAEADRDFFVDTAMPKITGTTADGERVDRRDAPVHARLARQGLRMASEILESFRVLVAVNAVLFYNIVLASRLPWHLPYTHGTASLLPATLLRFAGRAVAARWPAAAPFLEAFYDVSTYVFYATLTATLTWGLRWLQRRPVFDRLGQRQILVAHGPFTHKILWRKTYKMLSLSYGWASAHVHSANNRDDMIIDFGPQAGTLSLHAVTDGATEHDRPYHIASKSAATQYGSSTVKSRGRGAKVYTTGPLETLPASATHAHAPLPGRPPAEVSSERMASLWNGMFGDWMSLMADTVRVNKAMEKLSKTWPIRYNRAHTKDQVFQVTTRAPVPIPAVKVSAQAREILDAPRAVKHVRHPAVALPFEVLAPRPRHDVPPPLETPLQRTVEEPPPAATEPPAPPNAAPLPATAAAPAKTPVPTKAASAPAAEAPAPEVSVRAGARRALEISITGEGYFREWADMDDAYAMARTAGKLDPELIESVKTFLRLTGFPEDTLLRGAPAGDAKSFEGGWGDLSGDTVHYDGIPYFERPRQWPLTPMIALPIEVFQEILRGNPARAAEETITLRAARYGSAKAAHTPETGEPRPPVGEPSPPPAPAAAPSAPAESSEWLEARLSADGTVSLRKFKFLGGEFREEPAAEYAGDARARVEKLLKRAAEKTGARALRASLVEGDAPSAGQPALFTGETAPVLVLSAEALGWALWDDDDSTLDDALGKGVLLNGAPAANGGPAAESTSVPDAVSWDNHVLEIRMREGGLQAQIVSLDDTSAAPRTWHLDAVVRTQVTQFLLAIRQKMTEFPILRVVHTKDDKPYDPKDPRFWNDGIGLSVTPALYRRIVEAGRGAVPEVLSDRWNFTPTFPPPPAVDDSLLMLMGPEGMLSSLSLKTGKAAAEVAGDPASAGLMERVRDGAVSVLEGASGVRPAPPAARNASPSWNDSASVARQTVLAHGAEVLRPLARGLAPDPVGFERTARGLGFLHAGGNALSDADDLARRRHAEDLALARDAAASAEGDWARRLPRVASLLDRFNPKMLSEKDLKAASPLTLLDPASGRGAKAELASLLADGVLPGAPPSERALRAYLWGRFVRTQAPRQSLLDLSRPVLPPETGRPAVLALQAKEGHYDEAAALAAVEVLRRREAGAEPPPILLILDDRLRTPVQSGMRFLKALKAWSAPDGTRLTEKEANAVLWGMQVKSIAELVRAEEEDGERPDAGLARAAAAAAFKLPPGFSLTIADLDGRRWRVPAEDRDAVRVIELFLPGLGVLLTPEVWDGWRKVIDKSA